MSETEYTLEELSEKTGITARTIRYYISKNLLPPPTRAGRGAAYDETHLMRLIEIRDYKDQGHSLREIHRLTSTPQSEVQLPEPSTWWSYNISDKIVLNIRADASPWLVKQALDHMKKLASELEE